MILHTLNAGPGTPSLEDCLRVIGDADALILLGDGVHNGLAAAEACQQLIDSGARVYALQADVGARGVSKYLHQHVQLIDYAEFVALTEEYSRQQAWF